MAGKTVKEETKKTTGNSDNKGKNMSWVEFIVNVKYGDKLLKMGDKIQVSPIQENILARDKIAKKLQVM